MSETDLLSAFRRLAVHHDQVYGFRDDVRKMLFEHWAEAGDHAVLYEPRRTTLSLCIEYGLRTLVARQAGVSCQNKAG